jgi:hypothetical protein
MKKLTHYRFLAVAMALSVSGAALADDNDHHARGCTPALLNGLYIFAATGFITPAAPAPAQPKAIVEFIRFNGDGTLTVPAASRSINGAVGQSPPGGTGTYTIADLVPPDRACTGTLAFTGGPSFDLFVSPPGDEAWMIQNNAGNVLQGTLLKLAR